MTQRTVTILEREREVEMRIGEKMYCMHKSKGWIYLLELLRHPGQLRFAGSFLAAANPVEQCYRQLVELSDTERIEMGLYAHFMPLQIEMTDGRTIREVSARLTQLIELEATLRIENNLAALDDILLEKQKLQDYLAEVLLPGGKVRFFGEHGRREMRSVYMAIKRCLDGISDLEPDLGAYLRSRVKIWHQLSYEPGEIEIRVA
jgi:hypothetical protein